MNYQNPFGTSGTLVPYVNGNPATGVEGSIIPALAVQEPQTEIVNAITANGQIPTDADLTQLAQSVGYWIGTFGGTANALSAILTPIPVSIHAGLTVAGLASAPNTGSATLNVGVGGTLAVTQSDGTVFIGGEISAAGQALAFRYDGIAWRMFSPLSAAFFSAQSILSNYLEFSTPGSFPFTVPPGISRVFSRVWGGGGGGGGALSTTTYSAAGGGGGGGYTEGYVAVAPGQVISVTVGAGGSGGAGTPTSGGPGGTSSFGPFMSATGGAAGGAGNNSVFSTGTSGGSGTGGGLPISGFAGNGGIGLVNGGGGSGGGAFCSGPSQGSGINGTGSVGSFPGGGGEGTASSAGNGGFAGGSGGGGLVVVNY